MINIIKILFKNIRLDMEVLIYSFYMCLCVNIAYGQLGDTCKTIDGGDGSCIKISSCKPYIKLLEKPTKKKFIPLLIKNGCGFDGKTPMVCCPLKRIPDVPPPTLPTLPPPTDAPAPATTSLEPNVASGNILNSTCMVSNGTLSCDEGGINAKFSGAFPWMALLGYKDRASKWLCGGSLISTHHVLTAAHCIHNYETRLYVVRLGELDHSREDEGATPKDFSIKYKIKHEEYDHVIYSNDIGLVILEERVQFTDLIKPICIPQSSDLRSKTFENWNPFLAGWGHTEFRGPPADHLQVVQLPVLSNTDCAKAYTPLKVYNSDKSLAIDDRVLCAGYMKGGKDSCQGDSGGPLMQPIQNPKTFKISYYEIGVVSYGAGCAKAGFPGVYSRVTHFVPWLEKHVLGNA